MKPVRAKPIRAKPVRTPVDAAARQRRAWAKLAKTQPQDVLRDAELMGSTPRVNRHNYMELLAEKGQLRQSFPDDASMYDRTLGEPPTKKRRR